MLCESDSIIAKMYAHSISRLAYFEGAKETRIEYRRDYDILITLAANNTCLAFCKILDLLNYLTVKLLLKNYILQFYFMLVYFFTILAFNLRDKTTKKS